MLDEVHWLKDFFASLLEIGIECSVIDRLLISHPGETPSPIRIQSVFNALASNEHPDFIIMTSWLNERAKAQVSLPIQSTFKSLVLSHPVKFANELHL